MGIDLAARGNRGGGGLLRRWSSVSDFTERLIDWLEERTGDVVDLPPRISGDEEVFAMEIPVCASCEPIRITVGPGQLVELEARTTPGGPGYHEFLCGLMDAMADELGIHWEEVHDDSEYYRTRERAELERHMLGWMQGLCRSMLAEGEEVDGWMVCMPFGFGVQHPQKDRILTPFGPRSLDWMRACAADSARAREFFQWWGGEREPETLRNRALALMWSHVIWAPAMNEETRAVQIAALDALSDAYEADPTVDIPWREFQELIDIVGVEEDAKEDALLALVADMASRAPAGEQIGYLRYEIDRMPIGPWRVRLPGSMSTDLEDDSTFVASDGARTFRMSTGTFTSEDAPNGEELLGSILADEELNPSGGPMMEWEGERHRGVAFVADQRDEDREYRVLAGVVLGGDGFAFVTICFDEPADEAWAERVWRGIRNVNVGE